MRIIDADKVTKARTRVLLETKDINSGESWFTVGVSTNIIEASWQALNDSLNWYILLKKLNNS